MGSKLEEPAVSTDDEFALGKLLEESRVGFQCRGGFSGFCDHFPPFNLKAVLGQFQCRGGFSGFCDRPPLSRGSWPECFNAVVAFLGSATFRLRHSGCIARVSMPWWLFWVLRQVNSNFVVRGKDRFQCRGGFSGFCDRLGPRKRRRRRGRVSMPWWLFWVLRQSFRLSRRATTPTFQCRGGFSGFCDVPQNCRTGGRRLVSMPWWLFWVLRLEKGDLDEQIIALFQCRGGFSGFCDITKSVPERRRSVSMPWWLFWVLRRRPSNRLRLRSGVSMPWWLFWVLRRDHQNAENPHSDSFQCRGGFSGFCDSPTRRQHDLTSVLFQCRGGFSGFCDILFLFHSRVVLVFQCRGGFSGFCDHRRDGAREVRRHVSMPWWLFWVLRPPSGWCPRGTPTCFNAVVAFLGSATGG